MSKYDPYNLSPLMQESTAPPPGRPLITVEHLVDLLMLDHVHRLSRPLPDVPILP